MYHEVKMSLLRTTALIQSIVPLWKLHFTFCPPLCWSDHYLNSGYHTSNRVTSVSDLASICATFIDSGWSYWKRYLARLGGDNSFSPKYLWGCHKKELE